MAIKFDTFKTGGGSAPTGGLVYKGPYNATTQSPNLTSSLKGDFYIVDVEGTLAGVQLNVGDHIVFSQNASSPITSAMFDVIDNTDAVASVNSQTGVVVLDSDNIAEGSTNQYFTSARFTSEFNTKDSDDLTEGSTNLFYTDARFDTQLGTKTTTDLAEGSNLYHTNARVDARIAAATANDLSDVSYTAGAPIDGYVLKYNNTSGNWEAAAEAAGAVGTLQQVTDQGATTTNSITVGGVTIGTEYSLPTVDGTSGQALTTDGAGTLTFNTITGTVSSVNTQTGAVVLSANDLAADHAATNYTAANSNIDGHLSGIDTKLGTIAAGLTYKGTFNATAGTPDLSSAIKGDLYIVNTAGTIYGQTWAVGDHLLINEDMGGTITNSKIDKIDNTDAVSSVNTQTGAVVLSANDLAADHAATHYSPSNSNIDGHLSGIDTKLASQIESGDNISLFTNDAGYLTGITGESIGDLSDVTISSATNGQVLTYNGSAWVNQASSGGGGGSAPTVTAQNSTATLSTPGAGVIEEVYTVNSASAVTLTLVSAATVGQGFKYQIKRLGTGTVTIDPATTEYIDHSGQSTFSIGAQYDSVTLISDGTNWLLI